MIGRLLSRPSRHYNVFLPLLPKGQ